MHTIDPAAVMYCLGMRFKHTDRKDFPQAVDNPGGD